MTRLPDFVIVGALRSGSTTLYRLLTEHPEVFMAVPKEVRYFNEFFDRGLEWYAEHFARASPDQRIGEATPSYMASRRALDRMAATIPNAHLIAILRDPVDRVYSHYWMDLIRGRGEHTFERYLETNPEMLEVGRYVGWLEYLDRSYPRERILVLFYDDLVARPLSVSQAAYRFIGVDQSYAPPSLGRTVNQYVEFRSLRVRSWAKRIPRSAVLLRKVIDRLNTQTDVAYPPMEPETRAKLAACYAAPNAALAEWLGRDLPRWTTPDSG